MMTDDSLVSGFRTGFGSALLQFSFERLATFGSFAWKEISIIWGVEDELRKLQRTFYKIQELVERTENSGLSFSRGNKAWKIWYEDLRKLAYDADALLDHVSLHITTYSTNSSSFNPFKEDNVRSMILSSFKLELPIEINKMQSNLEDLAKEMKSLTLIEKVGLKDFRKTGETSCFTNITSLLVDEGNIVGRQQDKANVLRLLRNEIDDVSVIPIVGMGGIGKTTLAQLVYKNQTVCEDFRLKIWISVSIELDLVKIMGGIIESVTQKPCTLLDLNSLQLKVQEILASVGKFLIVFDDYWSEIGDEWNFLFAPIRSGCKGSKVIVTTRSIRVSTIVGSTEPCHLQRLSDDECWRLMKQRVNVAYEEREYFEIVGREIAKKCNGLPLAAKAIESVLYLDSNKDKWDFILRHELWDLPQDYNGIFPSLMLSYIYLPAHLQRCFAYCSIFPQNHEFQVEELVMLWMAEGFLQPVGDRKLEDIGKDYFNNLYLRSFFHQSTNSSNQNLYKMHVLIHDLARLVSSDTCVQVKHDVSQNYPLFGNACHLSLHHNNVQLLELKAMHKNERLRTFLVICKNAVARATIDQNFFLNLKFVRVLDLSNIGLSDVPDSIDHLIYLRYLNVSGNTIQRLPKSICRLLALQTLKILNNPELIALPRDMKNLTSLRHLHFDIDGKLTSTPPGLGNMTNLQSLTAFFVNKSKGHCIDELKNMDFLRGSLSIKNLDNVANETDASNAKLDAKSYVEKLNLVWEEMNVALNQQNLMNVALNQQKTHQASVIANLIPHEDLKELQIKNYSGLRCPDWLSGSTRKFTRIHLEGLNYCTTLPCLGELRFLKSLYIGKMPSLTVIDHNFYGAGSSIAFPSLESMELHKMKLITWKYQNNNDSMPKLMTFILDDCPELVTLPQNLRSHPNASINGCPGLQLLILPP